MLFHLKADLEDIRLIPPGVVFGGLYGRACVLPEFASYWGLLRCKSTLLLIEWCMDNGDNAKDTQSTTTRNCTLFPCEIGRGP